MTDTNTATVPPAPLTPEQIAEIKALEATQKASEAAARKAQKDQEAAQKAAQKAAEKAAREASRAEERAEKVRMKAEQKAQAEATKAASKMEQKNGVRRPKPDTICGRNWATYDEIALKNGGSCSIAEAMATLRARGVNDATIRTQYAHWRKFNGITGRVEAPKVETAPVAPPMPPPVQS